MAQAFKIADVPANNGKTASSGDDDATFLNLSEEALSGTPGHQARFKAIFQAIEEFRGPYEQSLRKAGYCKPGQVVVVTKTKFGWKAIIGKPRANGNGGVNIDDVK